MGLKMRETKQEHEYWYDDVSSRNPFLFLTLIFQDFKPGEPYDVALRRNRELIDEAELDESERRAYRKL